MSRETLACLVIDDPLLRPKYGPLNYKELLKKMKAHNFFTEIAFIPWNYKRSDHDTVKLFHDNRDHYALCVHGCNHVRNEFGIYDYKVLTDLSSTALWRMEQHKRLTGLSYDPIMVFPQGHFSSMAMLVLKEHGFLAAFNSTLQSTDGADFSASDCEHTTFKMYHDFPIFLRRYPDDKTKFIEDIAKGRPIIIVEHPSVFRGGYKKITDLIDWINNQGNIRWTSLLHMAEYYLGHQAGELVHRSAPVDWNFRYKCEVAIRRYLSEVRDNHVETNNALSKVYRKIRG